jgi:hypothetical protein
MRGETPFVFPIGAIGAAIADGAASPTAIAAVIAIMNIRIG